MRRGLKPEFAQGLRDAIACRSLFPDEEGTETDRSRISAVHLLESQFVPR